MILLILSYFIHTGNKKRINNLNIYNEQNVGGGIKAIKSRNNEQLI